MKRVSARVRIVGMTAIVVAVALAITVLLLRQVLLAERARDVDLQLEQEANELLKFVQQNGPEPGESGSDFARRVLSEFLGSNVPDRDESLLAVQDGSPFLQSPGAPRDLEAEVPIFGNVITPRFFDLGIEAGQVRLLAQPIIDDDQQQLGLLAIAHTTDARRAQIERTIRDAAIIAFAALLAATALAWVVAGRVLRPIGLLADAARDITEHDLTRRLPVQGADEIASLIVSFNSMLDRLEAVVGTQRRFLDDAGHELRTPITVMRGHLELAGDDPDQLRHSRPVILGELDRMGRIVDDLLLLARAEQLDFLARRPIDTDAFIDDVLARVSALGDQHWVVDEAPVGVIVADEERLAQAMLNLAVNATRHTPDGGEIGIGARFSGDRFSMWVRDTGEGIDPADHDRIFRRFARGTTQRTGGSAGLGLAIVQTIAEAHGGEVTLESERGHGATFTITIAVEPRDDVDVADDGDAPTEHERAHTDTEWVVT